MNHDSIGPAIQRELGALFTWKEQGAYYRIRTPFLYPDGDYIDLFCKSEGGIVTVTDLAETIGWLEIQASSMRHTPIEDRLILDACEPQNVAFRQGELQAQCQPGDSVAEVFTRVAQAALRVSDLWYAIRARGAVSITDAVAECLALHKLSYERAQAFEGDSQRIWNVDFHVQATGGGSLIYVLYTGTRAVAHRVTARVADAWHDLRRYAEKQENMRFVSLVIDTVDVWTDEDLKRVENLSTIAFWSRPDEFVNHLVLPA